ncbi:hypothetical protein N7528_003071 [Penicillium herquei]|nr:hypothetical protein N7528_003071 [Penicillium herquei]
MVIEKILFLLTRRWLLSFAVCLYALGLLYIAWLGEKDVQGWSLRALGSGKTRHLGDHPAASGILGLFEDLRLPVDAENFTGPDGIIYSLPYFSPQKPPFTKPLEKEILILDADTRSMNGTGEILNATLVYGTDSSTTMGRLNHYLFAKIHGYDYKFAQVHDPKRRHATWCKVPAIRQELDHYKFIVFLDADTVIPYLHLPLEWLLNYWNIVPETLLALARDPIDPINNDDRGRTLLNTGFMIAQQSSRTKELFKAWDECLGETRYPKCSRWGFNWPHEQGAFGNFIRYDFNGSQDIKVLPCAEANGCPESAHTGCMGRLVRHYWYGKNLVPAAMQESVLRSFVPRLHEMFLHDYWAGIDRWGNDSMMGIS